MKLIIAGSRTVSPTMPEIAVAMHDTPWPTVVLDGVDCPWFHAITEIVSGTASGADLAGETWAQHSGLPVQRFPADWATHGKAGGKLRNRRMAEYADAALVFWDGMSSGSCDMVTRMVARGKLVRVVPMRPGVRR